MQRREKAGREDRRAEQRIASHRIPSPLTHKNKKNKQTRKREGGGKGTERRKKRDIPRAGSMSEPGG